MTSTTTVDRPEPYRIDHPTIRIVMSDMVLSRTDLGPDDRVPSFDLPTTDGGRFRSADLAADDRPVLLVFGSLTCPVTESSAAGIRDLHSRYGDRIRFVLVYVREAHPGATTPQPKTLEQKQRNATALRARHGFPFEVAVDDIDGALHRAFGPRPNSAYLIDPSGVIVFRAQWANVTGALGDALAAVAAKKPPRSAAVGHTARAMAAMTGHADAAFATAGKGALRDTWKVAPPFGAAILLSRLFSFLPPGRRGLPTMALMGLMTAAALMGMVILLL
ncbi:peroxiredoxin family protein [Streptomyces sp. NPDC048142]|uniref:peroxiredoxin family protein n=1 Tax=Streptomyces sp. NPDC048142 TaxID=3365501 RepID=UPI0037182EB2